MVGRTVTGLEGFGPRTLRRHPPGPADFIARVVGRRVEAACRRGKYLWLPLSAAPSALVAGPQPRSYAAPSALVTGPQPRSHAAPPAASGEAAAVIAHLGMSGQFLAVAPDSADEPHLRARFSFDDGGPELRFLHQRPCGALALEPLDDPDEPPPSVAHIALDPIDPRFDRDAVYAALHRRRTGLKRALLD